MATIPSDDRQMITFCSTHLATWSSNQSSIGVQASQITQMTTALEAAQKALSEANAAREASKGATTTFKVSSRDLRGVASDIVRTIQTFAKNNNNPAVYGLADIPEPQPRSAVAPPPGQPSDFRANVNSDGSLTLTWKSNNPSGVSNVVYKISRALNGSESYTLIDTVGERSFTDATIPIGSTSVSYIVTGKRGTQTGPMSEVFTARFGSIAAGPGASGFVITGTTSVPSTNVKMAA